MICEKCEWGYKCNIKRMKQAKKVDLTTEDAPIDREQVKALFESKYGGG